VDRWDDEREVVFEDEPAVLPDQADPETGHAGFRWAGGDDDRLLGERPPHWE
jgi:hypothetical protein